MPMRGRAAEYDNVSKDEQSGSLPEADENDQPAKDNECEGIDNTSGAEQSGSPQRLPARNENRLSGPISNEEPSQSEGSKLNQDQDDDNECYSAGDEFESYEEWRRETLEDLESDKNIAQWSFDFEGHYSEKQENLIAKDLYGIDSHDGRTIFKEKMPGKIHGGKKRESTDVGFIAGGRLPSFEAKKPRTIRHRSHNVGNRVQGSTSNPNRGEQLISRPSKKKYGHLPQFHEELANSMAGVLGNSEDVDRTLAGVSEKPKDICGELRSHSSAESSDESQEKYIDGSVSSPSQNPSGETKKLYSLWGVDLYEEDFEDIAEDLQSSKPKSG